MSLELSKSNLSQLLISHDFNDFFVSGDASEVFLRKKEKLVQSSLEVLYPADGAAT